VGPLGDDPSGARPRAVVGDVVVLDDGGLDRLIRRLAAAGYRTLGPVVRDGAVVTGPVGGTDDLPRGVRDDQGPGHYRLTPGESADLFAWAVGPASWKPTFFPASEVVWRARRDGDPPDAPAATEPVVPVAIIGARPCDVAALGVLDRVLVGGAYRDARYAAARDAGVLVVAECAHPASTCFCTSTGTGPAASDGFDLALTELDDAAGRRFVVRVGTSKGARALGPDGTRASNADLAARTSGLEGARAALSRSIEPREVARALAAAGDHPRWADVATRCLSCGNCTLVCPTCFCSDLRDTTDLEGTVTRTRRWASCFDVEHSYLHGGPVRASTASRYRQWLSHKLSTWWDQFDTTGCVGCGRCVAWCPAGIDLLEEAAAIGGGATRVATPSTRSSP
jgi:ferredoxin